MAERDNEQLRLAATRSLLQQARLKQQGIIPRDAAPEPQEEEQPGPLDELLGAATWLLDIGNRYVTRPALGFLAKQGIDPRALAPWSAAFPLHAPWAVPGLGPESWRLEENLSPEQLRRVQQAPSYTQAYREATAGDFWSQLALESIYDPLNLVGAGLVGGVTRLPAVGRVISRVPALGTALDIANVSDELLGRIQALPVSLPLAGARRLAETPLGQRLLAKTPFAHLNQKYLRFAEALQEEERLGRPVEDWLRPEAGTRQVATQDLADLVRSTPAEERPALLGRLTSPQLARAWRGLTGSREALDVVRELDRRGLILTRREGNKLRKQASERLRAHLELDDALVTHGWSPAAIETAHDVLDAVAALAYNQNPGRFASLEDVYRRVRFTPGTGDTSALGWLDRARNDLIGIEARGNLTTIPHELGHLFERVSGPATRERLGALVGDVDEETFARALERAFLDATSQNPALARTLERYRQVANAVYRAGLADEPLPSALSRALAAEIGQEAAQAAPAPEAQTAPTEAEAPEAPVPQETVPEPSQETVKRAEEVPPEEPDIPPPEPETPVDIYEAEGVAPPRAPLDRYRTQFRRPEPGPPGELTDPEWFALYTRVSPRLLEEVSKVTDDDLARLGKRSAEELTPEERQQLIDEKLLRHLGGVENAKRIVHSPLEPWARPVTEAERKALEKLGMETNPLVGGQPLIDSEGLGPLDKGPDGLPPKTPEAKQRLRRRKYGLVAKAKKLFRETKTWDEELVKRELKVTNPRELFHLRAILEQEGAIEPRQLLYQEATRQAPLDVNALGGERRNAWYQRLVNRMPRYPQEIMQALRAYKGNGFKIINPALRGLQTDLWMNLHSFRSSVRDAVVSVHDTIERIDRAFALAPRLEEPIVVWRGARAYVPVNELRSLVGKVVRDRRFLSTSVGKEWGIRFAESLTGAALRSGDTQRLGILLQIELPAGTPVIPLDTVADFFDELELLLPRDMTFVVEEFRPSVDGWKQIPVLRLRAVPEAHADLVYQRGGETLDTLPLDFGEDAPPSPDDLARIQRALQEQPAQAGEPVPPELRTPPLANASMREVLRQVAAEIGVPVANADAVAARMERVVSTNPEHFSAAELWFPTLRPHVERALQATDPATRDQALADLFRAMDDYWSAFGVRVPAAQRVIDAILPRTRKPRPRARFGRSRYGSYLSDEHVEALREARALDEVQEWNQKYQQALDGAVQAARQIAAEHPGTPEVNDLTTLGDLAKLRDLTEDKKLRKAIDDFLKLAEVVDEDKRGALHFKSLYKAGLLDAYWRGMARQLGVDLSKVPRGARAVARDLARAWREQALLTPRYIAQNFADMTVKSVIHGVNPMVAKSAWTLAEKWGIPVPVSVANPRRSVRATVAGVEEFASPDLPPALGRLPGALGRVAGGAVQLNRRINNWMESAFRSAAWVTEAQRVLREYHPALLGEARRLVPGEAGERLAKQLETLGIEVSADDVLRAAQAAGADPTAARELAEFWRRGLQQASQRGEELATRVHFDLTDEREIERITHVKAWAPFHFWATRNIPFYMETLAQHPYLLRVWETYSSLSEEERERYGLTSRFTGTAPFRILDPFLAIFLGPATVYANPLVIMSVADQMKHQYVSEEQPFFGDVLQQVGRVGLRPAPWIDIPLGILGVYGPDWEPWNLFRYSGAIRAVTGINPEFPLQAAARYLRGQPTPTSGMMGSRYIDYLVSKRLAEMSLEETGRANHPLYVAAMADPSSPLYQRAYADVRRQLVGQELVGLTLPFPVKPLPETEALVRANQTLLPRELPPEASRALAQAGHLTTTYWRVSDDPRLAQINAGLALLPYLPNDQVIQRYPWLARYLAWLDTQPMTAERSPEAFIRSLG